MSEDNNWNKFASVVKKEESVSKPDDVLVKKMDDPSIQTQGGFLQRRKFTKIEAETALSAMHAKSHAELDVLKHQLTAATKVKKAEATVMTEQFLAQLDTNYSEILDKIGLRNNNEKRRLHIQLNDDLAADLKRAGESDWPPQLYTAFVEEAMKRYQKFVMKLATDIDEKG